jgi:YegS/Rv2252/BmrU family lipid kinase
MSADGFRTFLVVNPQSGGGATGKRFDRLAEQVRATIGPFEHAFTEGQGHATELTREALAKDYEMVVGVGGDGTFNEVVNGFFEGEAPVRPEAVFGIIPQGTGGDLRKTLGVPNDIRGACARLAGRDVKPVDVGHLAFLGHDGKPAQRVFINIASFGVGGVVVDEVNRSSKALGGKVSFMLGSVKALLKYKDQRITLTLDGGEPTTAPVTCVAVCNGQFFGGGMWVAPKAVMDDGEFDVTVWTGYTLKDFAINSKKVYKGTHVDDPRTKTARCKVLEATSDERVLLDVDGEQPGSLPMTVKVLPGALKMKY